MIKTKSATLVGYSHLKLWELRANKQTSCPDLLICDLVTHFVVQSRNTRTPFHTYLNRLWVTASSGCICPVLKACANTQIFRRFGSQLEYTSLLNRRRQGFLPVIGTTVTSGKMFGKENFLCLQNVTCSSAVTSPFSQPCH